jgi:predicted CopG family antitoxin
MRRKKLKSARLVTLLLEEEIYEKARQLARARGISFSELVRTLLMRELQSGQLADGAAEAEIERLEEEVARLEERAAQLAARGFRERGALKAEACELIRRVDEARARAEELWRLQPQERVGALKRRLNELRAWILS